MLTVKDIANGLKIFKPQEKSDGVELNLPLILDMNNQCFVVSITPNNNFFVISDCGYTFEKFNNTTKYYFDAFASSNEKLCNGFEVCNEQVCKTYLDNTSLIFALNNFIRFFIEFDKFICKNNLR